MEALYVFAAGAAAILAFAAWAGKKGERIAHQVSYSTVEVGYVRQNLEIHSGPPENCTTCQKNRLRSNSYDFKIV